MAGTKWTPPSSTPSGAPSTPAGPSVPCVRGWACAAIRATPGRAWTTPEPRASSPFRSSNHSTAPATAPTSKRVHPSLPGSPTTTAHRLHPMLPYLKSIACDGQQLQRPPRPRPPPTPLARWRKCPARRQVQHPSATHCPNRPYTKTPQRVNTTPTKEASWPLLMLPL